MPRVIILGGGLAGLAAAACLAEAQFQVEVLEKRPVLGGRASSFIPAGGTEPVDNCQHVLLGCCTNLLDFFRRTGAAEKFRFYDSFLFLGPGGLSPLTASVLPAPFHLLPSLLRFRDLGWRDRWVIARAMLAVLRDREPQDGQPMMVWLKQQGQTRAAIENFWRVVLTSALNEDLERLSSRYAFQVFVEAFLSNRRGYRMGVPVVPLSELYSGKILNETCSLQLRTHVARVQSEAGRVGCLQLQNGGEKRADYYISALPPDALASLFPKKLPELWPELEKLRKPEWSPITGIHLWFDRPVMESGQESGQDPGQELDHVTVLGRTIQWIFNRSRIGRKPGESQQGSATPQYIQLVVSASRGLMTMRQDEILSMALRELHELFPRSRKAKLVKSIVVKEAKATVSLQPGLDSLRLGARTPFENFFLAGDWTATGWPPTMEGAVRSGYRAAELVTAAAGTPQHFLQPGLPTAPLVRLLKSL
ncbi:MAG: FAD-dependent oxidoreductase [Acidobacteria bacterium]|nr:FAD-dependent oxidoreductase [Acidobacteriota bacterium]